MNALTLQSENAHSVRSLSLEEYITREPPPSFLARVATYTRIALVAWGMISLGAVAGIAAYYLSGAPETPILVGEEQAGKNAPAAKPVRIAMAVEAPSAIEAPNAIDVFAPASLPELSTLQMPSIDEARLPRPRPNEPIITGSLRPPPYDPNYAPPQRRRVVDPCTALRNLGAPVRCGYQARVYAPPPPPPPTYYPRPYHPPVVIQN